MRIWDVEPRCLCRGHLLGEHRELHGLWNILTKHEGEGGYSKHPETNRWVGKLAALYQRHQSLELEMQSRGYLHKSPLDKNLAIGSQFQDQFIDKIEDQKIILKKKACDCPLE